MGVRLIIDSASDITYEKAQALGVGYAPLKTILAGKEYRDGIDILPDELFAKLKTSKELASTSQVSASEFATLFAEAVNAGDDVVVITISSGLSGTAQSATVAAAEFPGKIFVVDSLSATAGEQVLLYRAVALRDAGKSAKEIYEELMELRKRVRLYVLVDTLEYLKRGGRVSKTAAFVGGMLHFMPLLIINEQGKLQTIGKARGRKLSHKFLNDSIAQYGGIDYDHPVVITYAGDVNDGIVDSYLADSRALYGERGVKPVIGQLGCVIGTHVGPGGLLIGCAAKE